MRPRQVGIMRGGSIGRIGTPIPFGAAMLANSRLRPDSCTATKSATWVCGTCRSRKVIITTTVGIRREVTVELVTQLNEMLKCSSLSSTSTRTRKGRRLNRRSPCSPRREMFRRQTGIGSGVRWSAMRRRGMKTVSSESQDHGYAHPLAHRDHRMRFFRGGGA
jgi:hypothetical protein